MMVREKFKLYCSTSSLDGMEVCAPFLVTETAAAFCANAIASSRDFLSHNATVRAATKQSPAAVLSTQTTGSAG